MKRVYICDEKIYRRRIVWIGLLLAGIVLYSAFQALTGFSPLWLLIAFVAAYGAGNTFLTKSNPREISVSDASITFRSFGEKTFDTGSLTHFRVKVATPGYQVYVKAADKAGNKGRFWIIYAHFSDRKDLLAELDYLERKTHPDSLRMRGRPDTGACRP